MHGLALLGQLYIIIIIIIIVLSGNYENGGGFAWYGTTHEEGIRIALISYLTWNTVCFDEKEGSNSVRTYIIL